MRNQQKVSPVCTRVLPVIGHKGSQQSPQMDPKALYPPQSPILSRKRNAYTYFILLDYYNTRWRTRNKITPYTNKPDLLDFWDLDDKTLTDQEFSLKYRKRKEKKHFETVLFL